MMFQKRTNKNNKLDYLGLLGWDDKKYLSI